MKEKKNACNILKIGNFLTVSSKLNIFEKRTKERKKQQEHDRCKVQLKSEGV